MKKRIGFTLTTGITFAVILLIAGTFGYPVSAQEKTGWKENEIGWWYQNSDGSYQKNGWFQDTDNNWYYFDREGYMQTGWIRNRDSWYFADESGRMQTGVIQINGQIYYFSPISNSELGKMQTGKVIIQDKVYYFNASGTAIGEVPNAERSYQIPLQDAYKQESKSVVENSRVNDTNKDKVILFESQVLEEMVRAVLREESDRSLTWNDLKGYTIASFQIMTDSRGKLVFQIDLGTEEGFVGMVRVELEELEALVRDLSKFPDLREVGIKGTYMKYSLSSVDMEGYEENLTDMEVLLGVLGRYLSVEDMTLKIDFEMSIKEKS